VIKIIKDEIIRIPLTESISNLPSGVIGIDMGQSLTKIARFERNELILSFFPTKSNFKTINDFLNSKKEIYHTFNFTGGKAYYTYKKFSKEFQTNLINEFKTIVKGIEFLHLLEKKRDLPHSLIISIGTGTSLILKKDSFKHLGGSAIGGGLFMGILKLVSNLTNFQEAMALTKKGNRYNLDLKVSDIYAPEDDRINILFREFTAASLGKIDENFNLSSLKKEDLINSLTCLIGENIGTIACLMAENNNINNLVFCGGFLKDNKILRKILSLICKFNKKKAIFLKNSEFMGAIGALF